MPTSNDGIMVILSSPSGAGKTTLVNLISKSKITLKYPFHIQHVNRRPNETPNKDYYFVDNNEFKKTD